MIQIVKFRYAGLWASEYPLVVHRLINIVEHHNPGLLHLQRSFDRLAAFRPQLDRIELQDKADRDSALLSELDQQRDTLFNVIQAVSKAFKRTPVASYSEHAARVYTALQRHGFDIPAANYTAETKRLTDLAADVAGQPAVMESLAALSLQTLFERMKEVNIEFDRVFVSRHQRQAEIEKVDIRGIRIECDKAITALWSAIEFCMAEHGEADYVPLVNAINKHNAYYKQQLAARATRRKAKQDVSQEEPIKPLEDN